MTMNKQYGAALLPQSPDIKDLGGLLDDYTTILKSPVQVILDRYQKNPGYGWIDTKFDLITGEDFPPTDTVYGVDTVYSWIQGRAVEALSGHAQWLKGLNSLENDALINGLEKTLREILHKINEIRGQNYGHMFFFMSTDGKPFVLEGNKREQVEFNSDTKFNYSDSFVSKGLYATAKYLNEEEIARQARQYCNQIDEAVFNDDFVSDQQQLDPKNPVKQVPGRKWLGPYLIQIGAAALQAHCDGDSRSIEIGLNLIEHILEKHVNINNRWPNLKEFDVTEYIDQSGRPYLNEGIILSDPGHSLEFIGLALKFTTAAKTAGAITDDYSNRIKNIESVMPHILIQGFKNGFQPQGGGICKHFDLISREALNTDMPWWSLPETMRAAISCWTIAESESIRKQCLEIFSACHNAFVTNYLLPERHFMAIQNRSIDGEIIRAIPATPDADPGYHTGLSLIDVWQTISNSLK